MDTFAYSDYHLPEEGAEVKLYNFSSDKHSCPWDNTGNYNPGDGDEDYPTCPVCGQSFHVDDGLYTEDDGLICLDCASEYVETVDHEYVHQENSDWVYAVNVRNDLRAPEVEVHWSDYHNEPVWLPTFDSDMRHLRWRAIEITQGEYEGDYISEEDVFIDDNGETWWIDDPERPGNTE